jgi:uncharacterized protein (DUF736 family)
MERDNTGVLFRVNDKKSDKHPDFTGKATIEGKELSIGCWINTSKDGTKKYMSLKFSDYKPKQETSVREGNDTSMTEVPF